jgi:RNA 2',3'-cyclic 3'-phosphodiesterase
MRLFTALLPPGHVLDGPGQLAHAVKELRSLEGAGQLRWTDRANWHITLAFFGEVADDRLPELRERLSRAAHRGHPIPLRIAGGGSYGDRALWAGLVDGPRDGPEGPEESTRRLPVESVRRLAASTAAAGRRAGVERQEPRRFHPHLTVARARSSTAETVDLSPYVTALRSFRGEPWTAGELALVRSNLPQSGQPGEQPRYEQVAAWPLGG